MNDDKQMNEVEKFANHHQVAERYFRSAGPRAIAMMTAARLYDMQAEEATWRKFEVLRQIQHEKLYFEIPKGFARSLGRGAVRAAESACHAHFELCKDIKDACQAFDFSRDTFNLLNRAIDAAGGAAAQRLALLPPSDLRSANRLDPANKKLVLAKAKELSGLDASEAARQLGSFIGGIVQQQVDAREAAEAEAAENGKRASVAEDKLRRANEKAEQDKMYLSDARGEAVRLRDKLNTPSFARKDEEILDDLRTASIDLQSLIGNVMLPCDALAARAEKDQPNRELNEIALSLLIQGTRLWGELLSSYLPAIDPGQTYTQFWAANALLQSPGTRKNLEQFDEVVNAMKKEAKK